MADAYGAIVAGYSVDFNGNLPSLMNELNNLDLSNDGGKFVINNDGILWLIPGFHNAQYPNLRPLKPSKICVEENGNWVEKRFSDVALSSLRDFDILEEEEISLGEISKQLSRHIVSGSLTLSCCSNEKQSSVESTSLCIKAGGDATRLSIYQFAGEPASLIFEDYDSLKDCVETRSLPQ